MRPTKAFYSATLLPICSLSYHFSATFSCCISGELNSFACLCLQTYFSHYLKYLFHYTLTQHAYTHQSTGVGELVGSYNVGMSEMTASPFTPPPSPEKEGTLRKEAGEEERNPGVSRHQLFMKCTTRIGNTFLLSNASGL